MKHSKLIKSVEIMFISLAICEMATAQYQVDHRVDTAVQPQTSSGAVDTRVNQELYGNTGPSGSVQSFSTSIPLPSEVLIAAQKSGATPSEIRANEAAIGPLTPNGAIAYIPYRGGASTPPAAPNQVQLNQGGHANLPPGAGAVPVNNKPKNPSPDESAPVPPARGDQSMSGKQPKSNMPPVSTMVPAPLSLLSTGSRNDAALWDDHNLRYMRYPQATSPVPDVPATLPSGKE